MSNLLGSLQLSALLISLTGRAIAQSPVPSDQLKLAIANGTISNPDAERAQKVHDGNFDVIVLPEDVNAAYGADFQAALVAQYGTDLVTWSVHENGGNLYVYAYPILLDSEHKVDARSATIRNQLTEIGAKNNRQGGKGLSNEAGVNEGITAQDSCELGWVNLFEHHFWQGALYSVMVVGWEVGTISQI